MFWLLPDLVSLYVYGTMRTDSSLGKASLFLEVLGRCQTMN